MNITIKGTGIELTDAISAYAEKKIGSLSKYLDQTRIDSFIARIEVGKSTNHHKSGDIFRAEVHIAGPETDSYAVVESEDLYSAIDLVEDELARELISTKGRRVKMMRNGERVIKSILKRFK